MYCVVAGFPPLLVLAPVDTPELRKLFAWSVTSAEVLFVVLNEESTILIIIKQ